MMDKASLFKDLHFQNDPLLLPNVWDAGGAYLAQNMGFKAIATTSAGIAFSNGLPDGSVVDPNLIFETVEKIVSVVDVPVTADIESGYGDIAGSVKRLKDMGVVGANIEDLPGSNISELLPLSEAVATIMEARNAAGPDFVLNARTDTYLTDQPNALELSIERGNAFMEAGADCIFVPGAKSKSDIETLVREINGPINIVAGLKGEQLTLKEYADLGVKRVSTGGSLMRRCFAMLETAFSEILDDGTFEYSRDAMPDATINALFRNRLKKSD
ncbi:isocitrate lyase/phosphoenolpyruvate mutase family protein [Terasakiella sp. A23]|uniref:isocitrate lyase/PEP mutase family protein n=1 Tax=Terasakiella sp. FCG-A23 TaxID=3080561 RepID=UPI002952D02F|nr:isocitrate lyase/phosphoenolpyruvate mutase family protein [Terasakiella sp. A23]MDV7339893.1 isocitrate lyase/phosphoenolpyruvate mutase family protein [Terasakiella sp. A23]